MPVHLGVDCGYLTYRSLRSEVTEEQLKAAGFGIRVAERTDDLVIAHSRTPDVLEKAFSRHGEGIPMKRHAEPEEIAALYAAFMDAGRIEALGASPLEAELAPLLGATDKEALARAIGAGIATGFSGVIRVGVENDLNDPDHYTTWVGQSGLGLPDESYYRQDERDEAMAALTALGYSAAEIEPVLRRAGHCSTAEETIRFALREFAGGK